MTGAELKQLIRNVLTPLRTVLQEYAVFDLLIDFITQSITNGIPAWTALLTFNLDGSGDGSFATYLDVNGALRFWKSKVNGNIGNAPPTNPLITEDANWIEVSPSSGSAIKEWLIGIYGDGLVIVHYDLSGAGTDDALYKLADPARPFHSTNFTTELAAGKWKRLSESIGAWVSQGLWNGSSNALPLLGRRGDTIKEGYTWDNSSNTTTLFGPDGGIIPQYAMIRALVDNPGVDPTDQTKWKITYS